MPRKPTYGELEKRVDQLEQKLAEKQTNTDSIILKTIPDLMFRLSKDGVHLDFHASSSDQLFVNPDDFLGQNVRDVLPADVSDKYVHHIRKAMEENTIQSFNYQLKFAPKDIRYYEARLNPISNEEVLVIVREITDRITSEKNLRRHLALLTSTQSLSKIGGWEWDIESESMYWTEETYRIHGFDPNAVENGSPEHIEKSIECYEPADRPAILEAFRKCVEEGEAYDLDFPFKKITGEKRFIRTTAKPVYEKDRVAKVIGNIMDITDQKNIENTLLESEAKYRFMTENMSDIIWTMDMNFQLTYVSPSVERLLGYSPDERMKQPFEEQVTPESFKHVMARYQEELERDKKEDVDPERTIIIEVEYYHKDGSKVWMENNIRAIRNQSGELIGMHGVSRDISDRKNAELSLKESQERYGLATKGGNVGVWDWNLITGDMFVSPNLKKMLGYEDWEIKNHIDDLGKNVYPEDIETVMQKANACIEGDKENYRVEHRMVHKDGSLRWFLATGKIERDKNGRAIRFLGTDTDITQLKKLEEKLRQSHKMEALGTLSGGIAHEFNNILGIIIGNTELAIGDVPEWNPAKDCLNEIRAASLRAKEVVRQILSFSRKTPSSRKPVAIVNIIRDSLKLFRATIPKNIDMQENIQCESEMVRANPTEINQVLMNLCSNAVHSMEHSDTGLLMVGLEPIVLKDQSAIKYNGITAGRYIKLIVRDNGAGIDARNMDHIFDPYFTTKDVDKGLGMGLAVVYGIVKKHDGAIKISSKLGVGTTVEVLFPITDEVPEKKDLQSRAELPGGTETILLVDDEPPLVKMVSHILERQGYTVVGKTSSIEALKAFGHKPEHFDLVISDMAMPEMPGDKLVVELLKIREDVPIILCTGYSDRIDEKRATALGVADYSMKPYEKKDLVKKVRKVLDEAKS